MAISYKKLLKMLIDRDISKTEFRDMTGISNGTLAKLSKGEPVALTILEKICTELKCKIEDIVEFIPDATKEP